MEYQKSIQTSSLEPGTPPPRTIITYVKREEGESLVFLDHVLDIDDVFWTWFRIGGHLHPRMRTRTERSVKTLKRRLE